MFVKPAPVAFQQIHSREPELQDRTEAETADAFLIYFKRATTRSVCHQFTGRTESELTPDAVEDQVTQTDTRPDRSRFVM